MRIIILSVLATLLAVTSGYSQSLEKVLKVGEESFDTKDYYSAFRCYETVLRYAGPAHFKGDTIYIKYKYAEAAQRFNYYQAADSMYTRLLAEAESLNPGLYARSVFNLARVKQSSAKDSINLNFNRLNEARLNAARELYQLFLSDEVFSKLDARPEDKQAFRRAAENGFESCSYAIENEGGGQADTLYRLSDAINSRYSDLAPVLQGNSLYYSSLKYYGDREKKSRQSRTYSKVLKADFVNNSTGQVDTLVEILPESGVFNEDDIHTVHAAFTQDGRWMFFSRCYQEKDSIRCTLYRRERLGDGWGKPQLLGINVDSTRYTSQQPSISTDWQGKQWLFFTSDRRGSEGGLDIWRSELDAEGKPGAPTALTDINTPWNEATPFYHTLSSRLYFSSDRDPSYGLYDIFVSYFDGQEWSAPENLELPYNSGYNDQYYYLSPDGSRAYFSSDRPESMRFIDSLNACCQDIYTTPYDLRMHLEVSADACWNLLPGEQIQVQVSEYSMGKTPSRPDSSCTLMADRDSWLFPLTQYRKYQVKGVRTDGQAVFDTLIDLAGPFYQRGDTVSLYFGLKPPKSALTVRVVDENTGEQFSNAEVVVRDQQGSLVGAVTGNYMYSVLPGAYLITASVPEGRDGKSYEPTSMEVSIYDVCGGVDTILYLKEKPKLPFPITFYFDNDKPDRYNGRADFTTQRFDTAYFRYLRRLEKYVDYNGNSPEGVIVYNKEYKDSLADPAVIEALRQNAEIMEQNEELAKTLAEAQIRDQFFGQELTGQFETFNEFMDALIAFLDNPENSLTIQIRGYCSPLGGPAYNKLLAKRRIICIRNYMEGYNNGALKQYIGNRLKIDELQVGVTQLYSDTPEKGDPAIFDYRALLARKVEIIDLSGDGRLNVPRNTTSQTSTQNPRQ